MGKFRKKPVVIEAFRYDGDLKLATGEWCVPDWAIDAFKKEELFYGTSVDDKNSPPVELFVDTLEGRMHISVGDYVIRGVNGELYPCKPDIFIKTYEPVV